MAIDRARAYLAQWNMDGKIMEFTVSSATVELAAEAVGCQPARIAKSLTFFVDGQCVMVVTAGDAKIDNHKYKAFFQTKAKMLSAEEVEQMVGHAVGGVCPFGIEPGVKVYLDISLRRFETVFPACGSSNSAIELTLTQLEQYAQALEWVDVCKNWQE